MRLLPAAILMSLVLTACSSGASETATPAAPSTSTPSTSAPTTAIPSAEPSSVPTAEPSAMVVQDPAEIARIYQGGLTALRTANTTHFDATFSGDFDAKGLHGGVVDLSSIRFYGDLDLANRAASAHFEAPVLGDLTMDLVFIGEVEYGRSSISKDIWSRRAANGSLGLTLAALSDVAGAQGFEKALAEGRVAFAQVADVTVAGVPAYRLLMTVKVPDAGDLEGFTIGALGTRTDTNKPAAAWPVAESSTDLLVTLDFAKDDLLPLGLSATLDLGLTKALVIVTFSDLGAPVTIKAPKDAVDATNLFNPYN